MPKTSIILQCAAIAVVASVATMPAGANAPVRPSTVHRFVAAKATATPKPLPSINPQPTCGPPVNVVERLNAMNPFIIHCPE